MGRVIIETLDERELKIRTSLTSKQIENLVKEIEKKEKAKKLVEATFGTLKESKNLERLSEEQWYEQ
ncbi:MAG: hypothetical protein GXO22_05290 [Aquificae bacterium]|nr:hypothetical protein [Aquificota bacterium]